MCLWSRRLLSCPSRWKSHPWTMLVLAPLSSHLSRNRKNTSERKVHDVHDMSISNINNLGNFLDDWLLGTSEAWSLEGAKPSYSETRCKLESWGCTIPVVTRFFCPPEIPLRMSSPTIVSAHTSRPNTCNSNNHRKGRFNLNTLLIHFQDYHTNMLQNITVTLGSKFTCKKGCGFWNWPVKCNQ